MCILGIIATEILSYRQQTSGIIGFPSRLSSSMEQKKVKLLFKTLLDVS